MDGGGARGKKGEVWGSLGKCNINLQLQYFDLPSPNHNVMNNHLLAIPRELRDEIFNYVLAPTGTITLIPHMEAAIRRGSAPVTILSEAIYDKSASIPREDLVNLRIDVRLLRVCRQIYAECREVLFKQNTFFFRNAIDLERALDEMGQKQSRRIEKIGVDFSKGLGTVKLQWNGQRSIHSRTNIITTGKVQNLGKVVRKSLSRARHGDLRLLGIRISGTGLLPAAGLDRARWEEFLNMGRNIDDWAKLQVSIEIWMNEPQRLSFEKIAKESEYDETELDYVLMRINSAWGGKLSFNGALIWEDRCRVGHV